MEGRVERKVFIFLDSIPSTFLLLSLSLSLSSFPMLCIVVSILSTSFLLSVVIRGKGED